MAKKGAGKRVVFRPKFNPQITIPRRTDSLRRVGRAKGWDCLLTGEWKDKKLEEVTYQFLMNKRMRISQVNTGRYFLELFHALYGGDVSRENHHSLFGDDPVLSFSPDFRPDVVIPGRLRNTYVEVKAASARKGVPSFAYRQYLRYSLALLEDKGSEMFAAIFKYGKGHENQRLYVCHNEDGHRCDNRCLVNNLSDATKSMIYVPHNLLTFLLMLAPEVVRDHTSSNTSRDFEKYKDPYAGWFTLLQKYHKRPQDAIKSILENVEKPNVRAEALPRRFSVDDFYLGYLVARQRIVKNVYCRDRKVGGLIHPFTRHKYFVVTEYSNIKHREWVKYFRDGLDGFVKGLKMGEDYQEIIARKEEKDERDAMRGQVNADIVVRSDDIAPF